MTKTVLLDSWGFENISASPHVWVHTHTQTWYRVTLVELKQTSFIYIYAYKTISKTSSLSCYMMLVHYQKRSFSNCLVFSILLDWHPTLPRHTHIYIYFDMFDQWTSVVWHVKTEVFQIVLNIYHSFGFSFNFTHLYI